MAAEVRKGSKGRWVGVGVILFAGWLLLLLGLVGVYMHRTLYNEGVFTKRVTAVLTEPGVQTAVATELTDAVITQVPKAVIARPVIQSAAETVVAEPAFTNLVTKALVQFHQLLLNPDAADLIFKVEGAPQMIQEAIAPYDEQLAVAVGTAASAQLAKLPNPGPAFQVIQLGADLGPVAWIVLFLGLALLVVAALIAPVRRKGVISACIAFGLVGLGTAVILNLINWGIQMQTTNDLVLSQAATGVYQGLFGDLLSIARAVLFVGIIAALVVWSLRWTAPMAGRALDTEAAQKAGGQKLEVADVLTVAKAWGSRAVTPAQSDWGKILQVVVALILGLVILFKWNLVVSILVLIVAVLLIAIAVNRLMILVLNRRADRAAASSGD